MAEGAPIVLFEVDLTEVNRRIAEAKLERFKAIARADYDRAHERARLAREELARKAHRHQGMHEAGTDEDCELCYNLLWRWQQPRYLLRIMWEPPVSMKLSRTGRLIWLHARRQQRLRRRGAP